jgi:hypothetical protein
VQANHRNRDAPRMARAYIEPIDNRQPRFQELTMNRTHNPFLGASQQSRLLALTLSAVFTLSMLLGIQTLAELPDHAAQMAQVTQPRA